MVLINSRAIQIPRRSTQCRRHTALSIPMTITVNLLQSICSPFQSKLLQNRLSTTA